MYTYSSLRFAPLYCLIHTPLSPPFLFVSPPGGGPSVIHTRLSEGTFTVVGVIGVRCGEGEGETRDGSPLKPLFPHPKSTTSLGISRQPLRSLPAQRI